MGTSSILGLIRAALKDAVVWIARKFAHLKRRRTQVVDDNHLASKIAPVLQAVADRIHYAETRRVNYTVMAGALIAGAITILVFASGSIEQLWLKYAAVTASLGFSLVGIVVVFEYGRQTNQYPYTSATKTWKWFYRDALPDRSAFGLKPFERRKALKDRITSAYSSQLEPFKVRLATLRNDEVNAEQDIEQLYSLHVNELYKNLYLSKLRSLFNWGLAITVVAVLGMAFYGWCSEKTYYEVQRTVLNGSGWSQTIEYRPVNAPLAAVAEVSFRIIASNKTNSPIVAKEFLLRDHNGWPVQIEIKQDSTLPRTMRANSSEVLFFSARIPRAVWDHATTFGIIFE